ncbi:TRAP transporter small permease [Sediminicola luteus]|uniref:C4-dicarboxylate ABC transporter permease n=1 Tax=Sediminicola luteus TaxID=319238 RepID=A0A2A4GAH2_9FLAO|nr:TRAP transporter small permease [Sediminicola luteus]PCE64755.1 C4-dicarboxylate ABC transporter permease [Sediminicola luteus]
MNFRKTLDSVLAKVLIVIMGVMVLNVLWQVFTRFVLGTPSSFTDELARYLMIWVGILGAAYVSGKNMHVAIDVLPQKLGGKAQKRMHITVQLLVMAFALLVMVIGGGRLVYITYILGQQSPALQLPLAYVYAVIPLSGILIVYYKMSDLLKPNA